MTTNRIGLFLRCLLVSLVVASGGAIARGDASAELDMRDIQAGYVIPDEGYCDQPYVVITK